MPCFSFLKCSFAALLTRFCACVLCSRSTISLLIFDYFPCRRALLFLPQALCHLAVTSPCSSYIASDLAGLEVGISSLTLLPCPVGQAAFLWTSCVFFTGVCPCLTAEQVGGLERVRCSKRWLYLLFLIR